MNTQSENTIPFPQNNSNHNSEEITPQLQFDFQDGNSKFMLPVSKPLDLKEYWIGNTNELIKRFDKSFADLKTQKQKVMKNLQIFHQNESRYKLSSLRKINFVVDKEQIHRLYMASTRKQFENLPISLILNIISYVQDSMLLGLLRLSRVSLIFSKIAKNVSVRQYLAQKDYRDTELTMAEQDSLCRRCLYFKRTILYYRSIQYTENIPPNSFKEDLTDAICFLNLIHRRVYQMRSVELGYFQQVNTLINQKKAVIGLSALSLTMLALIRKQATVAFSNHLALNPDARRKEQITKTKMNKVLEVVQNEQYKDSLVINTQLSNYLQQIHKFSFAVFIAHHSPCTQFQAVNICDVVIFNPRKTSFFYRSVQFINYVGVLQENKYITLTPELKGCHLVANHKLEMQGHQMPAVLANNVFGCCHVYRTQDIYLIIICRQ